MGTVTSIKYTCFIFVYISLLGACSRQNSAESILQDYLQRVEMATGVESQEGPSIPLLTYPSRRDRAISIEEIRIGFLDYLKFYGCDLFTLISQRNSTLGKLMPASKRLVYEMNFLQKAEACRRKLTAERKSGEAFTKQFEEIIDLKKDSITKIFWNATFDSPEMQKAFSLAVSPLDIDDRKAYLSSRQAIEYFSNLGVQLENFIYGISVQELEAHYYDLQFYQYGGRLFQSLVQLIDYLNRAAFSLETLISNEPICHQRQPNRKARLLNTVFSQDYLQRVQPYLAQIRRQGQDWLEIINRLIAIQTIQIPSPFADYRTRMLSMDGEKSLWQSFEKSIRQHSRAWQKLLGSCGLMPDL